MSSRPHSSSSRPPYKGKIVLIHAHEDGLKPKSLLITQLRGVALNEGYDFWWDDRMDRPSFNDEIRCQLEKADLIVCVLSQSFLDSDYVTNVEVPIIRRRMSKNLIVVPVRYLPFRESDKRYEWLKPIQQVPKGVKWIYGERKQRELYKDVTEYVQKCIRGRSAPYTEPEAISSQRSWPDESLTAAQQKIMRADAEKRARKYVPSVKKRRQICDAARARGASLEFPLSKQKLGELDEEFLMKDEGRSKRDPKKIRWVLRANGLHPQGRG